MTPERSTYKYFRRSIPVMGGAVVVESGRNKLGLRRPVEQIRRDVESQIAALPYYVQDQARVEASAALGLFAVGSATRMFTKTLTGGTLFLAGAGTAAELSNPLGWAILAGTAAVAFGRVAREKNRAKRFLAAAEKIGGQAWSELFSDTPSSMPSRRQPAYASPRGVRRV